MSVCLSVCLSVRLPVPWLRVTRVWRVVETLNLVEIRSWTLVTGRYVKCQGHWNGNENVKIVFAHIFVKMDQLNQDQNDHRPILQMSSNRFHRRKCVIFHICLGLSICLSHTSPLSFTHSLSERRRMSVCVLLSVVRSVHCVTESHVMTLPRQTCVSGAVAILRSVTSITSSQHQVSQSVEWCFIVIVLTTATQFMVTCQHFASL